MGIEAWYDALGNRVPHFRRAAAREQLRLMNDEAGVEWSTEQEDAYLDAVCKHIRADRPDAAIDAAAAEGMGLMAGYRILAYLCATEKDTGDGPDVEHPNVRFGRAL